MLPPPHLAPSPSSRDRCRASNPTLQRQNQSHRASILRGNPPKRVKMKVGDWVEVRSEAEILRTLDEQGQVDGMPFMPEMLRFCGQHFQIYKSAHKTCDSLVHQSRRLAKTVHLETRCSGESHGGCQSACLLFWKEEWLRPINAHGQSSHESVYPEHAASCAPSFSQQRLTGLAVVHESDCARYRCQATEIRSASTRLQWWDLWQYIEDVRSGNVDPFTLFCGALRAASLIVKRQRFRMGRLARTLYQHQLRRWDAGEPQLDAARVAQRRRTPLVSLNLQPHELVRVCALNQIEHTLDTAGQNRGLYFDPEQAPYAGKIFPVADRVERIINEETGRMIELKAPTVALQSVFCSGGYSSCRLFCPRSAQLLWREAWLERLREEASTQASRAWRTNENKD